ncbi:MAG: NAD-dependent succinate-semialdehyde dehydrogenase [Rhodocyclaceae bacterium]|nr:NAD-dependent succinate-semialdehyde dehydrogenase [Rhodocyclaceae bacterium]
MLELKDSSLLRQQCLIDNRWVDATDGECVEVDDPASGRLLGRVPKLGAAEVGEAIAAADRAWKPWRRLLARERAQVMLRWHRLMLEHAEDLARLMTAEQGKPLAEARGEVAYAASYVEWFAEEGKRVYGDTIPTNGHDRRLMVIRQPIGVCAAITPWNFPAAMITRKVGPALAAGCTVVVKPAEQTPFTALALAELAVRAGFPAGVINVVTGDPVVVGRELTASETVRKLSFTGSTEVGRLLMAQCAPTVKKLSLELGGNAPFIVFDDADVDAAVEGAVASKFRNNGQTCVCANRILVQAGIYERFAAALARAVEGLLVGDGRESATHLGPLIDVDAVAKVQAHVDDARALGARLLTGGRRHALGGRFFEPTVLVDVTAGMRIAREETFGPVAPLFRFETEDEAVQMANATEYGLAAYFFSRDVGRIFRVGEELEFGMIGINTGVMSNELAPFGGVKQSGIGREGSRYGIDEYLEMKYLCLGGIDR